MKLPPTNLSREIEERTKELESEGRLAELGDYYLMLGREYCRKFADIELSNKYLEKALKMFEDLGLEERQIDAERNLAINQELVGNYEAAYQGFKSCINRSLAIGYYTGYAVTSGGIFMLHLHLDDLYNPRVQEVFDKTQELKEQTDEVLFHESFKLGTALLHHFSDLLKERMKGQMLLEELVETAQYDFNHLSAVHFLAMSYIDEMLLTGSDSYLSQAKELFGMLAPQREKNFILDIRFTILEAKLELVSGNLLSAKSRLEEVVRIIEDLNQNTNIVRFVEEVNKELNMINDTYRGWKDLLDQNIELGQEIEQTSLKNFIEEAKKMVKNLNR